MSRWKVFICRGEKCQQLQDFDIPFFPHMLIIFKPVHHVMITTDTTMYFITKGFCSLHYFSDEITKCYYFLPQISISAGFF